MVKVEMDDRIAKAINSIVTTMPEEWALVQHYIALKLIRTRDQLENTNSLKLAGYAQGLRFMFELYPRALAKINGEDWKRDKTIVGEEGFVTRQLTDEDDLNEGHHSDGS